MTYTCDTCALYDIVKIDGFHQRKHIPYYKFSLLLQLSNDQNYEEEKRVCFLKMQLSPFIDKMKLTLSGYFIQITAEIQIYYVKRIIVDVMKFALRKKLPEIYFLIFISMKDVHTYMYI